MERIIRAFNNSVVGLITAYEQERSFREDIIIFALFFPLALFSDLPGLDKAILIMSLFLILITELVNTAIETVVDRISKETNPLSKMAKDVGSSIVLLAFANAIICWGFIYVPTLDVMIEMPTF